MKRLPKSLFDADYERTWRVSRRFLRTGLRLVPKRSRKSSHLAGGPTTHKGSKCPNCKRKLTLLWNVDLNDALLPDSLRDAFSPAKRLPFLICWQCVAALYRVTGPDRISCFTFDMHTDQLEEDETPFGDTPLELPERHVTFEAIPSIVDALLCLEDVVDLESLDRSGRKAIDEYYGTKIASSWDLPFSQIGGQPLIFQRHRNIACPNLKCPAHSQLESDSDGSEYFMKEIAVVHYDHEPVLAKCCFQILYYICGICFSMRAEYRCS